MNKKLIPIVVTLIIIIGLGFAYLLMQDKPGDTPVANNSPATSDSSNPTDQNNESAGLYTEYSQKKFTQTTGTKVLFFHAAWCPQCRELETDIKAGEVPNGVTIFKVDYDSNQKLRQKYGVSLQTTLVKVDDDGNELKKFVAYDEPTLEALIKNLL